MSQIVIYKMTKFPNDISVYQPVPCKRGFKNSMFFKNADAKRHCGNGYKPGCKTVEYKNEKWHFIIFNLKPFIENGAGNFNDQ